MLIKNKHGFTLSEVLITTGIFSVLALSIAEIVSQSNLQMSVFNLRQEIIYEHANIEKMLTNRDACFNTFRPANVVGALGTATLAAPLTVNSIRNSDPPLGTIQHIPNAVITNANYFPRDRRNPPFQNHAQARLTSKFFLRSVRVMGANTTNAFVAINAETSLPPNSFYVEFRYDLNSVGATATVSNPLVRAFGGVNGEFSRFAIFSAQYNGNNITACNSSIETELDDILVNSNFLVAPPEEMKFSDLDINGRLHVEREGIWAERVLHLSDSRLKRNIKNFPNSLDKILKLRGVEFNWVKNGQHDWGLIAQEVEEVLPDFVHNFDASGKKSVSYDSFVAPLIEAQKSLKNERQLITKEKNEIEKLLNQLDEKKEKDL